MMDFKRKLSRKTLEVGALSKAWLSASTSSEERTDRRSRAIGSCPVG